MNTLAVIPGMSGTGELILVVFVILLLFGAKKLPELSRSLGKSLGEFKKGQKEGTEMEEVEEPAQKEIEKPGDENSKSK